MKKYAVIMAGGSGTRFWPLSRQEKPKQLLNLSGKELMVNETICRLLYTVDTKDIFIVTNQEQYKSMLEATARYIQSDHILSEPSARNTSACIGYAAIEIIKKYGDGIMIITPSDAYIKDTAAFTRVLSEAVKVAEEQDKLVTIGIAPVFPATGYGYIKFDKSTEGLAKIVTAFKEKPDEMTAKSYISTGEYVWNSGIFIWKASTIIKKFEQYSTDIFEDLMKIKNAISTDNETNTIAAIYPKIRKISIDYAIMEPSAVNGDVVVILGEFGWNDVGSWDMLSALHDLDEHGNITIGDIIAINTTNSVIYSNKRFVAALNVDNLIIVETSDAVMVCQKDKAQDVKLIVDVLNDTSRKELL